MRKPQLIKFLEKNEAKPTPTPRKPRSNPPDEKVPLIDFNVLTPEKAPIPTPTQPKKSE